jgi:hypothetical protein
MRKVHFLTLLLIAVPLGLHAQQLPPPDVTFYGALEASRTDLRNLGIDDDTSGLRLRGGLWLNDIRFGRWVLGVEGAYNRLGDATARSSFRREPTGQELNQNGNLDYVTVSTVRERNVGGLEIGLRLYDSELFYLRGGAYLYSYRGREDTTLELVEVNGSSTTNDLLPQSETTSTLGPYAGAGFAFPLADRLHLTAELATYYIESEPLNSISLGIQVHGER